jgi:hypothetical protein
VGLYGRCLEAHFGFAHKSLSVSDLILLRNIEFFYEGFPLQAESSGHSYPAHYERQ